MHHLLKPVSVSIGCLWFSKACKTKKTFYPCIYLVLSKCGFTKLLVVEQSFIVYGSEKILKNPIVDVGDVNVNSAARSVAILDVQNTHKIYSQ